MSLIDSTTGEVVERRTFEINEQIIEHGLGTFIEVGTALAQIRDLRQYRDDYGDFDSYCLDRWGFDRRRASALIVAAAVSEISDTSLATESHASALAPLREDPDQLRAVLAQATAEAEAEGAKLTSKRIKEAVNAATTNPEPGEAADREAVEGVSPLPPSPGSDHPSRQPGPDEQRLNTIAAMGKSLKKAHEFFALFSAKDVLEVNDPTTAESVRILMAVISPWWTEYKAAQPTGLVVHQGGKA